MKRRHTFLLSMLCFGFAFFYIPILSMIVYSFNTSRLATVWGGFSTKWYVSLVSNDAVVNALFLSPLVIPHLVLGIAILRSFSLIGATGSFGWLVLAHVVIVTPYVMRLVVAAATGFDRSCEQAALSLGASHFTVFRRITLPMILPGVAGGWLLAFINSFDEVTMSIFVTAPSTVTLPVRMYMYATESIDPLMAAASALMVGFTAAVMVLLDRLYGLDRILVGGK